jgi:pimeloyl-ACP methyl ester carboxylesterase
MQEFVEDIHALLTHLHIEHCSIISHSFGALIAMEFTRQYSSMVERAIFLAPPYAPRNFRMRHLLANLGVALAFIPARLRAYGRTDYSRFCPTGDWSMDRIGTDIANMGLRSYLRSLTIVFAHDYTSDWITLHMPVLIIHGSNDALVPITDARTLAKALHNATLVELSGANHIFVLNNVEEVASEIEKFMQQ